MMKKQSGQIAVPTLEQIEAERKRIKYKKQYNRTLRSTIAVLIVAAAAAVLAATLWMPVMHVYGSSMSPTLEDGQIVVAFNGTKFETGDVVALWLGNKLLVKRVIAGPGDWVDIEPDGTVSVNDSVIDEPYLSEKAFGECNLRLPYQVPDSKWFVMGDNRGVSVDSRNTAVGCVSDEQIIGRIVLRIWPAYDFMILR